MSLVDRSTGEEPRITVTNNEGGLSRKHPACVAQRRRSRKTGMSFRNLGWTLHSTWKSQLKMRNVNTGSIMNIDVKWRNQLAGRRSESHVGRGTLEKVPLSLHQAAAEDVLRGHLGLTGDSTHPSGSASSMPSVGKSTLQPRSRWAGSLSPTTGKVPGHVHSVVFLRKKFLCEFYEAIMLIAEFLTKYPGECMRCT